MGGDLGGGFFSGSAPVIVPEALPALGFFVLGCVAEPLAGALYPAWLNRMQPLAQALKTGFAQQPLGCPRMIRTAARRQGAGAGAGRRHGVGD
jgi:hypothetical protein